MPAVVLSQPCEPSSHACGVGAGEGAAVGAAVGVGADVAGPQTHNMVLLHVVTPHPLLAPGAAGWLPSSSVGSARARKQSRLDSPQTSLQLFPSLWMNISQPGSGAETSLAAHQVSLIQARAL